MFPIVFMVILLISIISAILLLYPKIPMSYIRIHVCIISLPPIVALLALISSSSITFGPWQFDSLSWLIAVFVLTIGFIVQRYSIHYLLGDRSYRKYFTLITLTTVADSLAWLSDDFRFMLVCWGVTLLGLSLLIRLRKEWQVAKNAANLSGRLFLFSWFILLAAIIWVAKDTGEWRLSHALSQNNLTQMDSWEKTCINLLFIIAVIIPAAQWPFQRWLLDSVVAPTPISAVMHAGIVNAGGIMLTRFSPLFSGDIAQIILLILSSISVMIGTGIMLVQVDYKRQLVGSTIAQMGFMLIQCALGAYWAAIIHAVLHGLFKATLFLQAGSAIHHTETISRNPKSSSFTWTLTGLIVGIVVGIGFWLTSPGENYQIISAVIMGWSAFYAWRQLVAFGYGRLGRMIGIGLLIGIAVIFSIIHEAFYKMLHHAIQIELQPPTPIAIVFLTILLAASAMGAWLVRNRTTTSFTVIYLWLIRLSEPKADSVESHPNYLTQLLSRGGHLQ